MSISIQFYYLFIASISISLFLSIVGSIAKTSNDTTNKSLFQTNKWTIVKDYNFREKSTIIRSRPLKFESKIQETKFQS